MVSGPEQQFYAISDEPGCDHERVRHLAQGGDVNRYYRCPTCDGVLIRQGGPTPTGGTDDLGTVDPDLDDLLIDLDHYHRKRGVPKSSHASSLASRVIAAWRQLVS